MTLFVTGATGFIGSALVARLSAQGDQVTALVRPSSGWSLADKGIEIVRGDLRDARSYASHLRFADAVIHLAGITGRATAQEFEQGNVEGTRILLDECRRHHVPRFVYTSTIAVTFKARQHYHYAQSKESAEETVRRSGLSHAILRPTIVLGDKSPIWHALARVAKQPIPVMPGTGRVRIQPVWVEDVVDAIVGLSGETLFGETFELGGPDVVTFDEMIRIIGRRLGHQAKRIIHIPARGAIALLAGLERVLPGWPPVSAGQLYPFINDGVASLDKPVPAYLSCPTDLNTMLDRLIGKG